MRRLRHLRVPRRGQAAAAPEVDEVESFPLLPGDRTQRAETRRLIDWFNGKFNREVTHELLQEKVYARLQPAASATPDVDFLRAIRTNLRYHMSYISYLADRRRWLAGEDLSFADLAAAAHLSSVDYLGEVPWEEFAVAKVWYARLKSRRAFRTLLADRVAGVQRRGALRQPRFLTAVRRDRSAQGQMLLREAAALGFDAVRVTSPDAARAAGERLGEFLAAGRHGDMEWMATHAERRRSPQRLWPEVRSIVMLGMSYAPETNPLEALDHPMRGAISVYAQGKDYHDILKGKLKQLAARLAGESGAEVKVFVDTAPVMEKPLAAAAGLGWQGKNTMLVSREHGSWLFLGAIFTTAELPLDAPEDDHCGSCRRCLDVCPTAAFPAPYQLDARRCLAYLSIEHKGHIPAEFRRAMGNRVFGCDDCLAVCPWNKFAAAAREARFHARAETDNPPLAELLQLDDAPFRARFAGTPVKRTGRDRFLRNVLIAAGNSGDASLLPHVEALLGDASPLVRAMAVWAMRQLAGDGIGEGVRRQHLAREGDSDVRAEWHAVAAA